MERNGQSAGAAGDASDAVATPGGLASAEFVRAAAEGAADGARAPALAAVAGLAALAVRGFGAIARAPVGDACRLHLAVHALGDAVVLQAPHALVAVVDAAVEAAHAVVRARVVSGAARRGGCALRRAGAAGASAARAA